MRAVLGALLAAGAAAQSLKYIGKSLLIDLRAADFANATGQWDNRATTGGFSNITSGDFIAFRQAGKIPYLKNLDFGTGAGAIPVVWFPPGAGRVQTSSGSTALSGAGIYNSGNAGTGDFSFEAWVFNNGSEVSSGEVPVFQWGQRGTAGNGGYISIGSNPNYGAGGFFGAAFDLPWAAGNTTEVGPAGGQRPRANQWHHIAMTYTGNPVSIGPTGGLQAGTVTLYLDGVVNKATMLTAALTTARNTIFTIGQYVDTAGAQSLAALGLMVAVLRLHDGVLQPDEVAYNYALDATYFRGSLAGATGIATLATPTPSASPGAARCPTAWSSASTHFIKTISLNSANDTTAYARHCGFWLFWTSNYPVTDSVAAGDASQILRSGVDGTPGTYSLQSSNYPGSYLVPRPDGYLQFSFYATTVGIAKQNLTAATWYFDPLNDGSGAFQMRSRAPGMVDWIVSEDRTVPTLHACNGLSPNLRAYPPSLGYPPARLIQADSLMSTSAMSSLVYKTERVVVESLATPRLGNVVSQCNGRAIVNNDGGLANAAGAFTLVPPLACASVCGTNAFSLRFGSLSRYLTAPTLTGTSPVPLQVIDPTSAAYSDAGASFIGVRTTILGVTGWVLYPANGYAAGWVLQRESSASSCVDTACCLASTNATLLTAALTPAGGLTLAHLWSLKWEDSPTELTALPATSYAASACAATASPVASTTQSNTVSTSISPSPSNTPSGTASPSGTQLGSLSNTPSASYTPSIPPSISQSASATATATVTPTASSAIRIAGRLWIEMDASEYDTSAGTPRWNNRVSAGAISPTNGDFVGYAANASTWPTKVASYGFPGMPAVVFNVTVDGIADRLYCNHSSFPPVNSFYGQSDWSLEVWINTDGWSNAGFENGVFQWGPRNAQPCQGAALAIGPHPTYGAGGHWSCDVSYGSSLLYGTTELNPAAGGYIPGANKWRHVALTYTGPNDPVNPYTEYVYVDGQLVATYANRQLAIVKTNPLMLGAHVSGATFNTVDIPGRFALSRLRLHDGCLAAADVRYNYLSEGLSFQSTPTPTPSSTATTTGTQLYSFSPTMTPTVTPGVRIASSLLLELHADDYDAVGNTWDNRASFGPVDYFNGDFIARGPANSWPTKRFVDGAMAVVFNATADGALDRLETNSSWFSSGMYGGSDWSYEAWAYQTAYAAENPLLQWGPRGGTCTSAFTSMGGDSRWGAGGFFNCDQPFNVSMVNASVGLANANLASNSGVAPAIGRWHHLVWSFNGPSGTPANTLNIYVNGALTTTIAGRALNILRPDNSVLMGSFRDPGAAGAYYTGSVVALAKVRMHDGAMSAVDAAYNYFVEQTLFIPTTSPTPSTTPTSSSTASNTPSNTPTSTSSPSQTGSSSATGTKTVRPSVTPTRTMNPSNTPVPTGTRTPAATVTPTGTPTGTPTPSQTATMTPTQSATPTGSLSAGASSSRTPSNTASPSTSGTRTRTPSNTASPSTTASRTGTPSQSQTGTPSTSLSRTPARSLTPTGTADPTGTRTPSNTATGTGTVSAGASGSRTASATNTPSNTPVAVADAAVLFGLTLPGANCGSFASNAALAAALRCALSLSIPLPLDQVRLGGTTCENGTVITFSPTDLVNTVVAPACAGAATRRRRLAAVADAAPKSVVSSLAQLGPGRAIWYHDAVGAPGASRALLGGGARRLAVPGATADMELVVPPPDDATSAAGAQSAQQDAGGDIIEALGRAQSVENYGDSSPLMDAVSSTGALDALSAMTGLSGANLELGVTDPVVDIPSQTGTSTASNTQTASPTQTATPSGSQTRTPSASQTPSRTQTASSSQTASQTATPTSTPTSSNTASPSQTGTQTSTPTRSATASITATPSSSQTGTATASNTRTGSASQTGTPSSSQTRTSTATVSSTASSTSAATASQTSTQTRTPSASQTRTPSQTQTGTPSSSQTRTPSQTQTGTSSSSQTGTRSASQTGTSTPTQTGTGSASQTRTPSASQTQTASQSQTATPSSTQTGTGSSSQTGTPTNTASSSVTATMTATMTATSSATNTGSSSQTETPSSSNTGSASSSQTATSTKTRSSSRTQTAASTGTRTQTGTISPTRSETATATLSRTGTGSLSATRTATGSPSQTGTPSVSATRTGTPSRSGTRTPPVTKTPTRTGTPSSSGSKTGTPSVSATVTPTPSLVAPAWSDWVAVLRVGDADNSVTNADAGVALPLYVDYYALRTASSAPVLSLPLPTAPSDDGKSGACTLAVGKDMTDRWNFATEGFPANSGDGKFGLIPCYNVPAGQPLLGDSAKTLATIDGSQTVSTRYTGFISSLKREEAGSNDGWRTLASPNGRKFYTASVATYGAGFQYVADGSKTDADGVLTSVRIFPGSDDSITAGTLDARSVALFGGKLYGLCGPKDGTGFNTLFQIGGSGAPSSPTNTFVTLPGLGALGQAWAFAFADASSVWVSAERGTVKGTVQLYKKTGTTFALAFSVQFSTKQVYNLAGRVEFGSFVLYGTDGAKLYRYDTAGVAAKVNKPVTLATASGDVSFRGVLFPGAPGSSPSASASPSRASKTATASKSPKATPSRSKSHKKLRE